MTKTDKFFITIIAVLLVLTIIVYSHGNRVISILEEPIEINFNQTE